MTLISRVVFVAAIAAASIIAPASGQTASRSNSIAVRQYGYNNAARRQGVPQYFAQTPSAGRDDPSLTGGGSPGYNEMARRGW